MARSGTLVRDRISWGPLLTTMPELFHPRCFVERDHWPDPGDDRQPEEATDFRIEFNQMSGTLPESLGELSDLRQLIIPGNDFYGPIPQSMVRNPHAHAWGDPEDTATRRR